MGLPNGQKIRISLCMGFYYYWLLFYDFYRQDCINYILASSSPVVGQGGLCFYQMDWGKWTVAFSRSRVECSVDLPRFVAGD